ncbi:MAG: hypothetical protein C5B43_02315 [Verrucomicrobia bacterium]|nr:MAG: hypothetical protein C5B43_02315 [Verrucomicrobiota bacterium]
MTSRIKSCRVCHSKKLVTIGSLGKIAISDFTDRPSKGHKYPLELVFCERCTLLQLAHNTPRDLLYKDYWYQSHINPVIVKDLKEIGKLCSGIHYDIGANDGTLLKYSKAYEKIAIEPSNIKPKEGIWVNEYWENVRLTKGANFITAIACLYDLPNPNKFIEQIKYYLQPNGIFIAQLMTLEPMIENNDIGNICHEHLEYYSYKSLVYLFEKNGLEIFKVEKNNINGGSYRIFARHYQKGSIKFKEKEYGVEELKEFFERVEENRNNFINFCIDHQPDLVGYGASTKANTILQYYGIQHIDIVDINPLKKGKYMINSQCKIIDAIPKGTQYLWVFPYGFIKYFKKREKNYKGMWITTIPQFKII